MRHTRLRAGIALLALCGLASAVAAQDPGETLEILACKAKFAQSLRKGTSRHALKLTLRVGPRQLPYSHDPDQHALRVELDGVVLCDAPPGADGYRVNKRGRWRYRGEIAGGRVKVSGDGGSGRVKLKVSRAHLPDLRDSSAVDLDLSLALANTEVGTTASFHVLDFGVRRWRGLIVRFPPTPDPGPGPGPQPGPPPDPREAPTGAALKAAILADMQRRGVQFVPGGPLTGPAGGFDPVTLRCPSGNLAEVVVLAAPLPGSADMFSDTAYFCRDSRRYWLNRRGGFAGFNIWLGPYTLP